jgi:hypothetical protein
MAITKKNILVTLTAFCAGAVAMSVGTSFAAAPVAPTNASDATYSVSIDEIKQNFVFGDEMHGTYTKTVKMSDGEIRKIELRPTVKDGEPVIEFFDTSATRSGHTYMGIGGTTTNGKLMVSVQPDTVTR